MSTAIAQAAIAIYTNEPVPLPPPLLSEPAVMPKVVALPETDTTTLSTVPHDSHKIKKRLKSIETLLRGLHEPKLIH